MSISPQFDLNRVVIWSFLFLKQHLSWDYSDSVWFKVSGHIASRQIASIEAICLEAIWHYTNTCILPPLKNNISISVMCNYLIFIYFTKKILNCLVSTIYFIFSNYLSLCSLLLHHYSHQSPYIFTGTKVLAIKNHVELAWLTDKNWNYLKLL